MAKQRIGVYPGTFDPIHNGHLDVIARATRVVDKLFIAVAANIGKDPLFDLPARSALVQGEIDRMQQTGRSNGCELEIAPFSHLLMDFAREVGAGVVIRGLRAVSDFEYEFQMAANNKRLFPEVETLFLMASETNQFISSRFVKEIGRLGGDISSFVSKEVAAEVSQRVRVHGDATQNLQPAGR